MTYALRGALAALLLSLAAVAQDTPSDPGAAPDPNEPLDTAVVEERGDAKTEVDPAPGNAPQDYEASEQISEDLSVSFPVDI